MSHGNPTPPGQESVEGRQAIHLIYERRSTGVLKKELHSENEIQRNGSLFTSGCDYFWM
jgi:hypothetical protein